MTTKNPLTDYPKLYRPIRRLSVLNAEYDTALAAEFKKWDTHATIYTPHGDIKPDPMTAQAVYAEFRLRSLEARDGEIERIRAEIDTEAERMRGEHSAIRHRAHYKLWPAITPEVEAAMRGALQGVRSFDDLAKLHAGAMGAKDFAAAAWLEQNADPEANAVNDDARRVALYTWQRIAEDAQRVRGGDEYMRIARDEDAIGAAQSAAKLYRTTREAEHMAAGMSLREVPRVPSPAEVREYTGIEV